MNNSLAKWMNILKVSLAVIGIGICLFLFNAPNVNTNTLAEVEAFRESPQMSAATYFTIFVLAACVALVLIFFVVQLISNPKKTLMSIIGLVVALVLFVLLLAVGTGDTSDGLGLTQSIGEVSKSTINSTTAGIYTVLAGLLIAVLAIIVTPFLGKLRK